MHLAQGMTHTAQYIVVEEHAISRRWYGERDNPDYIFSRVYNFLLVIYHGLQSGISMGKKEKRKVVGRGGQAETAFRAGCSSS